MCGNLPAGTALLVEVFGVCFCLLQRKAGGKPMLPVGGKRTLPTAILVPAHFLA